MKWAPLFGLPWPESHHGYPDYARILAGDAEPKPAYDVGYAQLKACLEGVAEGHPIDGRALMEALAIVSVRWPRRLCPDPPKRAPERVKGADLVRMALDMAPAMGEDGPVAVLGPWLQRMRFDVPAHHAAIVAAIGTASFAWPPDEPRPPVRSWLGPAGTLGGAYRDAVVGLSRTPPLPWRLVSQDGDRWHVEPLLRVSDWWVPTEAVSLPEVGAVDGPPQEGGLLLARIVPTASGWYAGNALVLPECPAQEVLEGWFTLLALPQLVGTRTLDVEDLLRRGGHLLVGWAHRWWWTQA